MKKLGNLFLQGLIAILPIAATIFVLYWLGTYAESVLGSLLKQGLPDNWYWPGMGLLAGVAATCLIGLLVDAYLFQQFNKITEKALSRIPLVKTIYNGVRDVIAFLAASQNKRDLKTTVLVRLNDDMRVIGFITSDRVPYPTDEESVAVYLPMSYQIGGYTIFIPKNRLEPLNVPIEDAMRMVITASMSTRGKQS
jgi:uncharacterized membrane protein